MVFEDIVLKQEEVISKTELNWNTFWWVFFIAMIAAILITVIYLIFTDDTVKMKLVMFAVTIGLSAILIAIGAYVCSSSQIGGINHYETHYTVEAEAFYKSEFTKDYEIVSQDGRLLVVREVTNE